MERWRIGLITKVVEERELFFLVEENVPGNSTKLAKTEDAMKQGEKSNKISVSPKFPN